MAHQPESFWYIQVSYTHAGGPACEFQWDRERIFDPHIAATLYEACLDRPEVIVLDVSTQLL